MAFSRKEISRDEKRKGVIEMSFEPSAASGRIGEASQLEQTEYQVMNNGQNAPGCADGHASRIFMEGYIPPIM
jgi:hypothetical protein